MICHPSPLSFAVRERKLDAKEQDLVSRIIQGKAELTRLRASRLEIEAEVERAKIKKASGEGPIH